MKKIHLTATRVTVMLALLFVVAYTLLLGLTYPNTLHMMEQNCGVHDYVYQLFRWPWLGALLMALVAVVPMIIIAMVLRMLRLPRMMPAGVLVSLALAYWYPPTSDYEWGEDHLLSHESMLMEHMHQYERLAEAREWAEMKRQVVAHGEQNSNYGMRYMLLAESAMGTLADNLFLYPISETEQLLFRGLTTPGCSNFNRLFYENLGVYDECYHQAQEYAMANSDFCLLSLCKMVDYCIEESEWDVADKFLTVLDEALFYHDFVRERRAQVEAGRKVRKENPAPLRANNFVTGYPLKSEMYHNYVQHIGDTDKAQEYMLLCLLIRKDLNAFCQALRLLPLYKNVSQEQLPQNYQQAIQIYLSHGEALHDAPHGTYAYYFYNTAIPEEEQHPEPKMAN